MKFTEEQRRAAREAYTHKRLDPSCFVFDALDAALSAIEGMPDLVCKGCKHKYSINSFSHQSECLECMHHYGDRYISDMMEVSNEV